MSYRNDINDFNKETRWTFWKILPTGLVIVVISALGFGLNSLGLIGSTAVERIVMEQSFQYKQGMQQRAAILEANMAEVDMLLNSNPENRQDLINQKSVLRAQLRAITINN